jgi:two-component system, OmpR family, response regulator PrrA
MRILVVEDDDGFRTGLVTLLERLGHSVCWAATGESGVFAALNEKPDLVLLDIGLPDITGYEVARRLPRGLPLIILSGIGPEQIRSDAVSFSNAISGALLILGKPTDTAQIEEAIALIGRSNGSGTTSTT